LVKKELDGKVPLIGFAGSPWTIFAYMLEGGGSKTFSNARKFLYCHPKESSMLLGMITKSTIRYLKDQVKAGADIIQVFDTWAGLLSEDAYYKFVYPHIERICDELSDKVPVIFFPKNAFYPYLISGLDCSVIGLDWTVSPIDARMIFPDITLQGNLDPSVLFAGKKVIIEETHKMMDSFGIQNYIANLGHGIYPDTPEEHIRIFVDAVKQYPGKSSV
jgi:uroporphyrinogen decarboxylase